MMINVRCNGKKLTKTCVYYIFGLKIGKILTKIC